MLRINQIKISLKDILDLTREQEIALLSKKASKILKGSKIQTLTIIKKSIDARDKQNLLYIYSVDVICEDEKNIFKKVHNKDVMLTNSKKYQFPFHCTNSKNLSPVIIGAGPAGYFCGLYLARAGFKPIIIERGKTVEERMLDVEAFWSGEKPINPSSNVSFGEGGAGTFSDGKLNTGIKDKNNRIEAVLSDFVSFGASEDITYLNKPHIGTDVLCTVMSNMRNEIIRLGGEIQFQTTFVDYKRTSDSIKICLESNNKRYNTSPRSGRTKTRRHR